MLTFFRRIIHSKLGMIVTFGVLIVIALAFAAGDITGLGSPGGGILGSSVASVDGEKITADDLRKRAQDELRAARQQQPDFDMAQLVAQGGVEALVTRAITGVALETFGQDQGMRISRALVGSELKNIPAFAGPTGQFDQQAYERLIAQRGMNDAQVQREVARETMAQFLMVPTIGAGQVPQQLALPYASLLLERRAGQVALIPAAAVPGGPAPTDAEIQQWYRRNVARYTMPERRVLRYARVDAAQVQAHATPSDAEIAQSYATDKTSYAPKEQRTVTLVTVLDQNAANALAAKVKAGTPVAAAARTAGLEARTIGDAEKATIVSQSSAAAADAIYAAPQGGAIGPVRGAIGFVVARVDAIKQSPGKTLAQARDEIATKLRQQKTAAAIGRIRDAVEDALADNANINEVVADQKLTAATTPALLSNGLNPDQPAAQPDPALAPIVAAGFAAEDGDTPTTLPTGQDGSFAIVGLERIDRAAPIPLAQVRARVLADVNADRARRTARQVASTLLAKVNSGTPLATALSQAGVKAPPVQPLASTRAQLNADPKGINPVLALLFSMSQGSAKMLESPDNRGWLIVKLDRIVPGDATRIPGVIAATRGDLGRSVGREYAEQFANAVSAAQGAKRDTNAIAQLKKDLLGAGGQ